MTKPTESSEIWYKETTSGFQGDEGSKPMENPMVEHKTNTNTLAQTQNKQRLTSFVSRSAQLQIFTSGLQASCRVWRIRKLDHGDAQCTLQASCKKICGKG